MVRFTTRLKDSVEEYVQEQLSGVHIERVRDRKQIRDALTATSAYDMHEVNILDLPIIQRLRRIHQTALAFLTYPCAGHNRFQHTLGVTNIATKLARSLEHKHEGLVGSSALRELRLAAILHDIGHGPFSHPSEEIMGYMPEVKSELQNNPKFSKAKPHEMLSYFMVVSDAFKGIVQQINTTYQTNIDAGRVANMIVGDMDDPDREAYLSNFINGSFDADKLDYIPRDAYFSGLKMDVDLDRIAYTLLVPSSTRHPRTLCCDISGAHNLEQILFNKVLLYSAIYHHHKVRATVCMLKSVFEIIHDRNLEVCGLNFQTPVDFLRIDDYDVIARFGEVNELSHMIRNLKNRQLLKRALVISKKTVKDPIRLNKYSEDPSMLRKIRDLITDEINSNGGKCTPYDVWIDFPDPPSLEEASKCMIKVADDDFVALDEIFPATWWLTAYGETKWKGHVFCPPQTETRKLANKAAIKVLKNELGVEFEDTATTQAKIPDLSF